MLMVTPLHPYFIIHTSETTYTQAHPTGTAAAIRL